MHAPKFWYQSPSFYAYLLAPVAWLYRLIVRIRRQFYNWGLKKSHVFSVPIIVVGNITVGGTGKTPLVYWLVNWLKTQGYRPGIVSRGYGGKENRFPQTVTASSDPAAVGDEAVLLKIKTDCPVAVCANRPRAVEKLLAENECTIVVCDDGLQHYALARNIEIAVIDGDRQFGNRRCLPAGPLREPISRLKRVDFVIARTHSSVIARPPKQSRKLLINSGLPRRLAAPRNDVNEAQGRYTLQLTPLKIYQLKYPDNEISLSELKKSTVHAVAGIGNPQRFFKQLIQLGMTVIPHPFPDHHRYRPNDFNFGDDRMILLTEKDAVKCRSFADDRFWCVIADVELSPEFSEKLLQRLREI